MNNHSDFQPHVHPSLSNVTPARYADYDDNLFAYRAGKCPGCGKIPLWVSARCCQTTFATGVVRYGTKVFPGIWEPVYGIRCPRCFLMTRLFFHKPLALDAWLGGKWRTKV